MIARLLTRLRHLKRWPIRSAGGNFALAYGVVFLLSAGVFLSFTWWSTTNLLDRHVQAGIESDAQDLTRRWVFGGAGTLSDAIEERIEQNVDDDALYLLVNRNGQRFAGNLPGWPVVMTRLDHFYELSIRRYTFSTQAKLKAYALPGGFRLIVGHDVRGRHLLRHVMAETLIWCAIMVSLLAMGGAFVIRKLFLRIVHSIARTTAAVASGDLNHRIALNGSETDLVAETVNTMLDRINRLMEGVRQVSNAIAHDLRTPIARARTQLEDAALHAQSDDELRNAIDLAVQDLDRITGIFEALLRIAQIEAGSRRSAFASVDLTALLHDIAELYEASAEEAGLTLHTQIATLPAIIGDRHMVQQALANLLDNAIKFSPSGSQLTLRAERLPDHENTKPTGVAISVSDQGPGMSASDMERAHERFFRAEAARSTPGSGLGLSLVQAIAGLHHGQLTLSHAHPGLTATLTLPLNPAPSSHKTQIVDPI
ncbi:MULTISPECIES: HAMP domain-containing sensor histidine kinase [unclassified Saccharibacter]|uniref:sensor histidine kinase n=1 Tax=unclassified Saccharibacter TaxID=2648722 RepID=UPI0013269418|nr:MULTISPECIES: HAMP domain-containing sensor histidine kinase [unclassified Saccharibacter]MXV37038.1 HAMP domain-containing protein [Saccharibacter sp. EH611]MXV58472.1 HAMP domain-containing protein [Saccharibacter sp. EH70]MXV65978.1 HAMP domain-containing protein [Saccharibacter sp. EH60]